METLSKITPLWKPSCSLEAIRARAEVYASIRAFFCARNVLEVDTPLLSISTATDPHLESITSTLALSPSEQEKLYFLHTSPEFPMKRLLAAGTGSIYQLCKTFRNSEYGHRHNPEFTMLEWYRINFNLNQLMAEVEALVSQVLGQDCESFERISYRDAFKKYLGVNPFTIETHELIQLAEQKAGFSVSQEESQRLNRDDYLNVLLSICIEPQLGQSEAGRLAPVFLYAYPPSQASLARLNYEDGELIAERFELYINGLEIANGYFELTDYQEQRRRFEADNSYRKQLDLPTIPLDENLLSALKEGVPECSGVALGVDRLLMIKLQATSIEEVLSFPITRA